MELEIQCKVFNERKTLHPVKVKLTQSVLLLISLHDINKKPWNTVENTALVP